MPGRPLSVAHEPPAGTDGALTSEADENCMRPPAGAGLGVTTDNGGMVPHERMLPSRSR